MRGIIFDIFGTQNLLNSSGTPQNRTTLWYFKSLAKRGQKRCCGLGGLVDDIDDVKVMQR